MRGVFVRAACGLALVASAGSSSIATEVIYKHIVQYQNGPHAMFQHGRSAGKSMGYHCKELVNGKIDDLVQTLSAYFADNDAAFKHTAPAAINKAVKDCKAQGIAPQLGPVARL
jgi:hypothetical protein